MIREITLTLVALTRAMNMKNLTTVKKSFQRYIRVNYPNKKVHFLKKEKRTPNLFLYVTKKITLTLFIAFSSWNAHLEYISYSNMHVYEGSRH